MIYLFHCWYGRGGSWEVVAGGCSPGSTLCTASANQMSCPFGQIDAADLYVDHSGTIINKGGEEEYGGGVGSWWQ